MPAAPVVQMRPLNILLAEDNPVNQRLALALLRKQGHTVALANHGLEAILDCQDTRYDLILMDVQMPEMGGLEATAAIRRMEAALGDYTPIIALTAHAIKGDRERCLAAGTDGYVSKPVKPAALFQALDTVLATSKPRPALGAEELEQEFLLAG